MLDFPMYVWTPLQGNAFTKAIGENDIVSLS